MLRSQQLWGSLGRPSVGPGEAGRTLRLFTLPLPGLHTVWKVLHVQLGPRWTPTAEDDEGWDRQWAGDHAGHPAGRVPARLGRDWYVPSQGPSPRCLCLSRRQGPSGLHLGPEAGLGRSPFLPASRHLLLGLYLIATLTFLGLPLPGSVTLQGNQPSLSNIRGHHLLYK